MDSREGGEEGEWYMQNPGDLPYSPPSVKEKRKYRSKKMEFIGWGSKQLIEFLMSLGKDTSQRISQHDLNSVIMTYVRNNNLYHPQRKKKILCDEKLHCLFGRKSVARVKVYDLLEPHYVENKDDWDDIFSNSDENEEDASAATKKHKPSISKLRCPETPKSCFASIIPSNIKLVYLKKSLILELLKNPETFEGKVIGSFVRVKADPRDIFAKYSHQLQQVIGVKMGSGLGDAVTETLLEVPTFMKEIRISMLSGDNFSEEECNDLQERVKNGTIKKLTVVELEVKVQQLHEDITKHWIKRELSTLQNLIDQANEKGWRKELFEYLERRDLLQKESEQTRLLTEIPKVIADELEVETAPQEESVDISPKPSLPDMPNKLIASQKVKQTASNHHNVEGHAGTLEKPAQEESVDISPKPSLLDTPNKLIPSKKVKQTASNRYNIAGQNANRESSHGHVGTLEKVAHFDEELKDLQPETNMVTSSQSILPYSNHNQATSNNEKMIVAHKGFGPNTELIELSDDDDDNEAKGKWQESVPRVMEIVENFEHVIWHYTDPQGVKQGPFSLSSLKRWYECNYFPSDFKIWKTGKTQGEAVPLVDVLRIVYEYKI